MTFLQCQVNLLEYINIAYCQLTVKYHIFIYYSTAVSEMSEAN